MTDVLEKDGILNKMRAEIRSKVFQTLNAEGLPQQDVEADREEQELNHLICEYLQFHGYLSTLEVFRVESNTNVEAKVANSRNQREIELPKLYQLLSLNQQEQPASKTLPNTSNSL